MPTNTTPAPLTVREICAAANLTQSALAARFGIPKRTVENWCSGVNKCPDYTRRMMMECLWLLTIDGVTVTRQVPAEFHRRMELLGLVGEFPDVGGHSLDFFPVDPEAEPLHPDWRPTSDYGGGAYDQNGKMHFGCRRQFCMMPCDCCQHRMSNLINGFLGGDDYYCTCSAERQQYILKKIESKYNLDTAAYLQREFRCNRMTVAEVMSY